MESTNSAWDSVYYTTYLKVTIVCRYIFLRFWLKTLFVSTKFYDLYAEMVQVGKF